MHPIICMEHDIYNICKGKPQENYETKIGTLI